MALDDPRFGGILEPPLVVPVAATSSDSSSTSSSSSSSSTSTSTTSHESSNSTSTSTSTKNNISNAPYVAVYFTATCRACKTFTPALASWAQDAHPHVQVVAVLSDNDAPSFDAYRAGGLSWAHVLSLRAPTFRAVRKALTTQFAVVELPTLVLLAPDGSILTTEGVTAVREKRRLDQWWESPPASFAPTPRNIIIVPGSSSSSSTTTSTTSTSTSTSTGTSTSKSSRGSSKPAAGICSVLRTSASGKQLLAAETEERSRTVHFQRRRRCLTGAHVTVFLLPASGRTSKSLLPLASALSDAHSTVIVENLGVARRRRRRSSSVGAAAAANKEEEEEEEEEASPLLFKVVPPSEAAAPGKSAADVLAVFKEMATDVNIVVGVGDAGAAQALRLQSVFTRQNVDGVVLVGCGLKPSWSSWSSWSSAPTAQLLLHFLSSAGRPVAALASLARWLLLAVAFALLDAYAYTAMAATARASSGSPPLWVLKCLWFAVCWCDALVAGSSSSSSSSSAAAAIADACAAYAGNPALGLELRRRAVPAERLLHRRRTSSSSSSSSFWSPCVVPVLVMRGESDGLVNDRAAAALAGAFARGAQATVKGAGHRVEEEQPVAVAAEIAGAIRGILGQQVDKTGE